MSETFFSFLWPCMNYWSGVDKNTDNRKSIFNQEAGLFLLMRENMSLLLHCLNLNWVSSQFQQMTIGNTYFIISPLNYRWDPEVFMFRFALLCSKNENESIFSKCFIWIPGGLHHESSIQHWPYVEVKMLWISNVSVLRKEYSVNQYLQFRLSFWG